MRKRVDAHVNMQKIVPNVNALYRGLWDFPEDHESVGFISCDVEDVMYFALDDATKKARIHVVHVETVYGGVEKAWSRYGGEITAIISGPKVEDVRNGLMYIKDYIENKCGVYVINDDPSTAFYVDLMPRIGKWNQERLGLPANSALAYLVATPIEATYALDKALKASNTKIVEFFDAPSRVNTGGALLAGSESACKAAVEAFADAVEFCYANPMSLDS
ncbi:MAG: ethanolamine utilization microcompartment protein EutL [Eubacteriales bacterium]|nr:ethanolamine utilization microcompartment protein EutL [Eubacteriales bacterium]